MKFPEVSIFQQNLADYRVGFYQALRVNSKFNWMLFHGSDSFSVGQHSERPQEWSKPLDNRFFLGRRILIQQGVLKEAVRSKVCVMEMNFRTLSTWGALIIRRMLGRPNILWGHTRGKSLIGNLLRPLMIFLADGFLCYTIEERNRLISEGFRLPVGVAQNACMNLKDMVFSIEHERNVILYVGRLSKEKKPELLLKAFADLLKLNSTNRRIRLVFVGDGPLRAALEAEALRLGVIERTEFIGQVSSVKTLSRIYGEALVSVSPGFVGLSCCQSFSFGVPMVICQDEDHSPEIAYCHEGFNTIFSPSDSPVALSRNLGRVLRDAAFWRQHGPMISVRMRSESSFEGMAQGFSEFVSHFLRKKIEQ